MHAGTVSSHAAPGVSSRWRAADWPHAAAIALIVGLLGLLAFDDGGYFPASFQTGGALAFAGLGALLLARPPRALSVPALVALGALAGLAAWTGLSGAWSLVPDVPQLDMQRAMLYLALFALGLLAAWRGAALLVWCVLGTIAIVCGAGLLSRLQPDLVAGTPVAPGAIDVRLSYPLGYWNAFGALATIGGVLAIGLAADPRAARLLRALAAGVAVGLLVAMYLSLSRGAWLAFLVGILALVALSRHRAALVASLAVVGTAVAAALLLLRSYPALVDGPRPPGSQAAQGDAFTLRLAVLVVAAAAAQAVAAGPAVARRLTAVGARVRGPVVAGACAVAVLAALLLGGASRVSEQWKDFSSPSAALSEEQGTARLASVRSSRGETYRVALAGFAAQPLRGEGAGSYEVRWMRTRTLDDKLRDAHSLALQTLAELGLAGFALLAAFVGAALAALVGAMRGRAALRRSPSAAVGAAFAVWLVHASLDWDWEMPALTGAAVVLASTLFASGEQ
jgi:hypothetical protein